MKNIALSLLFFTGMTQAQFIQFPDANLKSKILAADVTNQIAFGNGGYIKVDADANGEIDTFEALQVDSLNVYFAGITDLTGVNNFTNLKKLDCNSNGITSFDGAGLEGLAYLDFGQNPMATANISMLTNMKYLYAQNTNLGAINVTGMPQLEILNVLNIGLTQLDLTGLSELKYLYCSLNRLTTLNLTGLSSLIYVDCSNNQIATWNVSNLQLLKTLYCQQNAMASLTLQNLPALIDIDCSTNLLTSLVFSGIQNVQTFACHQNKLSALDVNGLSELANLNCNDNLLTDLQLDNSLPTSISIVCSNNLLTALNLENLLLYSIDCANNQLANVNLSNIRGMYSGSFQNNQLTTLIFPEYSLGTGNSLNVSNNPLTAFKLPNLRLMLFDCSNTMATELDFSNCPAISIQCNVTNNLVLQYINVKNGDRDFCWAPPCVTWTLSNNPLLQHICVDDITSNGSSEAAYFISLANGVSVSSYCTFIPGGSYNTITGQVLFDSANDGCANDPFQPNIKLTLNDAAQEYATIITTTGDYHFYTLAGNFTLSAAIETQIFLPLRRKRQRSILRILTITSLFRIFALPQMVCIRISKLFWCQFLPQDRVLMLCIKLFTRIKEIKFSQETFRWLLTIC